MRPDLLASLRRLSDAELVARVHELAARERGATALLVAHLAELDTREVHFRAGHGSLFAYCRDVLGLAEQEAYNRIAVARAARRYPEILDMLDAGALNLTAVRLLGPHLTAENHQDVLERARGKTKAQVEELAAALWPRPDAPTFVRRLPAARTTPSEHSTSAASMSTAVPERPASRAGDPVPAAPPVLAAPPASGPLFSSPACSVTPVPGLGPALPPAKRSAEVTPLSPDRYKVQVTIGGYTLEKLQLAKDLLRHAVPSGDEAVILDRALTALLEDLAQKKFAAAEKPRPSSGTAPASRHVPADVKRTVWLRDLGRCAFVGASGRRCSERAFLEFHHVKPFALGGEATVANIQLRCRSHNAYEARLYFGQDNGNGGAGCVRETATACDREQAGGVPPGVLAGDRYRPSGPTRSGTSSRFAGSKGPTP